MDQQLQNYVKQSRESGMTDEQIRRGLLNAGWGEEDIKGAFSQPEFRSTPEIPKNSGFKKELGPLGLIITSFVMSAAVIFVLPIVLQVIVLPFSLIFAILALIKAIKHRALKLIIISVIAILLPFAIYGYTRYSLEVQDQKILDEIRLRYGLSDTADWQTYRNEKYGFEVKYPTTAVINRTYDEPEDTRIFLQLSLGSDDGILICTTESKFPCTFTTGRGVYDKEITGKIIIGNNVYDAAGWSNNDVGGYENLGVGVSDKVYIQYWIDRNDIFLKQKDLALKILSTFRFVE